MFQARKLNSSLPSKIPHFDKSLFHRFDGMENISTKWANNKTSKTLKHSYNVIEVFKPFFPTFDQSWMKKKAENLRVIFRRPFCLRHWSHMLYLRMSHAYHRHLMSHVILYVSHITSSSHMHVSCHQLITWLMSHAHHTHPCHTLTHQVSRVHTYISSLTCTHIHIKSHVYTHTYHVSPYHTHLLSHAHHMYTHLMTMMSHAYHTHLKSHTHRIHLMSYTHHRYTRLMSHMPITCTSSHAHYTLLMSCVYHTLITHTLPPINKIRNLHNSDFKWYNIIPKAESHTKIHHITRLVIITTIDGIHVLEYSCNGLGVLWSYPRKVLDLPLTVIQTPMLIVWVLWDMRTMWTSISTISTYTVGLAGRKPKKRHKSIHTSAM